MLEGARVVVTGGAGFIGSHLVERLAGRNDVVAYDLAPATQAGNLAGVSGKIAYVEGDVRNLAILGGALHGAEVVFHLAALVSVPQSFADPRAFHEANTEGTLTVLRAAKGAGVRRVVFASTCAVYGGATPPCREDGPLDLRSPYAVTKAAGELWCRLYHDLGLETVALRLFNVYGPRQPAEGPYGAVIPKFLEAVGGDVPPTIDGDGDQTRDFVYVGDAAEAFERAATAPGASGEAINVGSGEPVSMNRLFAVVQDVLRKEGGARTGPARPGDIRASHADTEKAERILGFRARVTLPEGLLAMWESRSL